MGAVGDGVLFGVGEIGLNHVGHSAHRDHIGETYVRVRVSVKRALV